MPLPANNSGLSAVDDLGLGGMLQDQVAGETEEQRKKRMQELQQRAMLGGSSSPATMALFGDTGAAGG